MRFMYGAFFGSFTMCVFGTTVCNAWFTCPAEYTIEYRALLAEKRALERDRDELRRMLELDALRRSQRDPVNPAGTIVPPEDRIPAPREPFPIPKQK